MIHEFLKEHMPEGVRQRLITASNSGCMPMPEMFLSLFYAGCVVADMEDSPERKYILREAENRMKADGLYDSYGKFQSLSKT